MSQLSYWKVLTRKKTLTHDHETETRLNRVLGTYDLTALGVGATLGVGVYVLAGHVARDQAGPSVVLSFLIAALASLLAGLCYAEFGARVPRAGSAYTYSYVCIGEFAAFIIGWNLILEYVIGSASVCRGISLYLDTLLNNTLKTTFNEVAPIEWGFLGAYFDFFAFTLAIVFGVILAFGIQTSALLNNFCTIVNIGVIIFVVIAGSINADIRNWQIDPNDFNTTDKDVKLGAGGFFPFGFEGTLRGAATCFFGFVGFDCIATTGEEVREPRRAIPRAILFSLLIIFLSYFSVSTVLTLMWPYYLQDIDAPLPFAFQQIGWEVAKWIVTIGGMLGLIASLLGALLPLPRIIYAMARDGLVFKFLGIINTKFKTPVIASISAACLTGFFAGLFDLTQLVNMLSIGTLLAYTVIAICLTILRFMDNSNGYLNIEYKHLDNEGTNLVNNNEHRANCRQVMIQIFNFERQSIPNSFTTTIVTVLLLIYCACAFGFSLTVVYAMEEIKNLSPWAITLLCIFALINIFITLAISVQPREEESPYFKVPLVPLTPAISIFVNIYLMLQLDIYTWIRFGIWMIIGLIIYLPCICLYDRTRCDIVKDSKYNNSHLNSSGSKITTLSENGIEKNHSNDNELVKANGVVVLAYKNELDQNSNEIVEPIKTSSPKQSLDDIVLESEFSDSLKEMKHSNGDRYLVEHTSPRSINDDESDEPKKINEDSADATKSALDILDNVLQEEETENYDFNRQLSIDSEQIPSFLSVSTAVVIHRPNDCFVEEVENEIGNNANSGSKDSGIEQDTENDVEPNFTVVYVDENSIKDNSKDTPEISMATANPGLVNLNEQENSILEPESNLEIEQVLIPGSNILINSPKVTKSNKVDTNNPNPIEETPRPSLTEENEKIDILNPIAVIPLIKTESKPEEKIKDTIENENSLKNEHITPLDTPKNEQIQSVSPKVTRTFVPLKSSPKTPTLSRKLSTSSTTSYENPLHSETFKEKLSKIMGQNTMLKVNIPPTNPQQTNNSKDNQTPEPTPVLTPKTAPAEISEEKTLKSSKSEADLMRLVLNDIKNLTNENNKQGHSSKESSKTLNENNIPKPPKFDPVLYKSLGAVSRQSKERPKLEELVGKDSIEHHKNIQPSITKDTQIKNETKSKENDEKFEEELNTPEQFKKRLAAIIQRGPSYKMQRQYPTPSNKEITTSNDKNANKNNYSDVLQSIRDTRKSISKPINNTSSNKISNNKIGSSDNNEPISLENVRKSLKPI